MDQSAFSVMEASLWRSKWCKIDFFVKNHQNYFYFYLSSPKPEWRSQLMAKLIVLSIQTDKIVTLTYIFMQNALQIQEDTFQIRTLIEKLWFAKNRYFLDRKIKGRQKKLKLIIMAWYCIHVTDTHTEINEFDQFCKASKIKSTHVNAYSKWNKEENVSGNVSSYQNCVQILLHHLLFLLSCVSRVCLYYVYLFREKMFVCLLIYYYLSVCYSSKQSYNIYHLFLFICLLLVTSVSRHISLEIMDKSTIAKQQQMHSSLVFTVKRRQIYTYFTSIIYKVLALPLAKANKLAVHTKK